MRDPNPWKPDPRDERIPIGAPDTTVSMHHRRTVFSQAMPPIEHQSRVYAHHMLIGRVFERFVGKLHRIGKEVVGFVFGHSGSVRGVASQVHSWFPSDFLLHASTVRAAGA